jgi:hypothetical protein
VAPAPWPHAGRLAKVFLQQLPQAVREINVTAAMSKRKRGVGIRLANKLSTFTPSSVLHCFPLLLLLLGQLLPRETSICLSFST